MVGQSQRLVHSLSQFEEVAKKKPVHHAELQIDRLEAMTAQQCWSFEVETSTSSARGRYPFMAYDPP